MPAIELPNGQSAIIKTKDEITEREARVISRAYMRAAGSAVKLSNLGFDETKPETWAVMAELSDEDQNNLDGYQAALIAGMVKSWSFPTPPSQESALDLPRGTFTLLADACGDEYNRSEEFGPDGAIDPKAPTAD